MGNYTKALPTLSKCQPEWQKCIVHMKARPDFLLVNLRFQCVFVGPSLENITALDGRQIRDFFLNPRALFLNPGVTPET